MVHPGGGAAARPGRGAPTSGFDATVYPPPGASLDSDTVDRAVAGGS
jgi:hypothetical protein